MWLGLLVFLLTRVLAPASVNMSHMYFYQEMRAILKRMEEVLPITADATPKRLTCKNEKEAWYPVIEANPDAVSRPIIACKRWRFASAIPPPFQEQGGRRDFVQEHTTMLTSLSDGHSDDKPARMPCGLSFWHPSDATRRLLPLIRRDLDALFAVPCCAWIGEQGAFALPGSKHLCYQDCMDLVRIKSPYLFKACWEYARLVSHMFDVDYKFFVAASRLRIHRHAPENGCPLRLSQSVQSRYDGGPVIIVSLGLPLAVHDFTPTLQPAKPDEDETPVRVTVSDGVMMLLDADARARYSHGVPKEWGGGMALYTLEIHMDCMDNTTILDYEPQTRTMVMYTPLCGGNVITTRPAPASRVQPHVRVRNDTLWRIVQGMRARLQAAESCLIRQKYGQKTPLSIPDSAGLGPRGLWD